MTDDDIKRLRGLCAAATAGPWRWELTYNNAGLPLADFAIPGHNGGGVVEMLAVDAALIAAARTALPAALDEIERLRGELDEREADMHARIRAGYDRTVADSWRAKVGEVERERDEARAEVERLRTGTKEIIGNRWPCSYGPPECDECHVCRFRLLLAAKEPTR